MAKTVAILQSSYIPWKGYFDLIRSVDEFILYDDVQYTKRDWRSRNRIKTPNGTQWLTIPVEVKGKFAQAIREAKIADPKWASQHWKTIQWALGPAPFFKQYRDYFAELYLAEPSVYLSEVNRKLIHGICRVLKITTPITSSSDYGFEAKEPTEQLIDLCVKAGATHYVSGPAAKDYLEVPAFEARGLTVSFFDYGGYPEYEQLYPPFDHAVNALDLIFHQGDKAMRFLDRTLPTTQIERELRL